jgi:integrase
MWTDADVPTIVPSMASLLKRPRSKFWFAAFTDANGRRLKKSTKTTDKRLALRIADEFETAANKRRTYLQVRRVLGEFSKNLLGVDMKEPTVREHFQTWLAAKAPTTSPSTAAFYQYATAKFVTWLGTRAEKEISLIQRGDITLFRNERASVVSPKTVNHEIKVLRMVFRAARKDGILTDDPAEFVETLSSRNKASVRRAFTIEELKSVIGQCNDEWRSLVFFGLYTGQRLGDLAALKWSSVDLEQEQVRLRTQKTGKSMSIPISAPLMRHILTLPSTDVPDAPLHPRAFANVHKLGRTGGLSNQFADILAAAGLREKKVHRKTGEGRGASRTQNELTFHALRHTAVSMMKNAGIPAAAVMEIIGHDSEQMSEHYTHVGKEAMQKAAAALPDLVAG